MCCSRTIELNYSILQWVSAIRILDGDLVFELPTPLGRDRCRFYAAPRPRDPLVENNRIELLVSNSEKYSGPLGLA